MITLINKGDKRKIIKKKRGFTFYELVIVVGVLGVLISFAVPSLEPTIKYTERNITNTTHKILISAIDGWVKDNYDSAQRPDNFNSINSQGQKVYNYINNTEVFENTNLRIVAGSLNLGSKENNKVFVEFSEGVLKTSYIRNTSDEPEIKFTFGVFALDSSGVKIQGYAEKVDEGYIISDTYREVGSP